MHIPAPQAPPSTTKPAVSMPAAKAAPTVSPGDEKRHKEQAANRPQHSAAATSANFKALSTFRVELPLEQCRRSLLFALTPVHPAYEMESDVTSVPGYFQVGFSEGELETRGLQSGDVLRQMHGVHTYNMSRRDLSDIVDAVPAAVGKVELLFTRDEGSRALAQLQTDVLQDPGMDCTLYKARVVSTLQFQGYIRKTSKAGAPPLPTATAKALPSSSSAPAAAAAAASLRPPTINTSLPKSKPPTSSSSSPRTAVLGQSEAAAAIAARKLNPPAPTTGKAKTMEKTKTQTKGVFGWERKARPVECSYKDAPTAVIHRWVSVGEAAKQLGVHKPAIYLSISRGRALRHRLLFRYSDAKDTAATTDELITLDELCAALKKDVVKSTKQGGGGDDSDGEDMSGDDDDEDDEDGEDEEENGQEQQKNIHKSFAASSQRACPHCGELLSADNFQKRLRNHELHACKKYKGGQKEEEEEERESESEAEMEFSKQGSKRRRDEPDAAPTQITDLLNFLAVGSEIEASQKANAPRVNWHRAKIVEMGTGDREGEALVAWQVGGRGSWLPMTSEHMALAAEKRSRRG